VRSFKAVDAYVIIATKGRPREVADLLRTLARQSLAPKAVIVVGVTDDDVPQRGEFEPIALHVLLSPRAGLTAQRNVGIAYLADADAVARGVATRGEHFVAFFDDDFRPAGDWLERCREAFVADRRVVGLTGRILADGAQGASITDAEADAYLSGALPPEPHWAGGTAAAAIACVYGCNMAFRDRVFHRSAGGFFGSGSGCRFDENLPLYGWQEDQDFTSQARAHGTVIFAPACRGVHQGTRGGRVSGVRFGYSQIANPLYLMQKGTMGLRKGAWFLLKAAVANSVKSAARSDRADYPGRLRGNVLALADLVRRRCHPLRVLDFA
jgi:GT2 family glycosyltransferase